MYSFRKSLENLGERVLEFLISLGDAVSLFLRNLKVIGLFRFRARQTIEQIYFVAAKSLGIIVISSFFVGMVLAMQTAYELQKFGLTLQIANIVCVSLVRELSPVFTALLLAGRVGSGITAEMGSMKINDQIKAMKMLNLDVDQLILAPRIIAVTLAAFSLTIIFDIVGIGGGYIIGVVQLNVPFFRYHNTTLDALLFKDVGCGLIKAIFFGAVIAVVSCYFGLTCKGGARGLGENTKKAVVSSSIVVLVSDFFLTKFLILLLD